MKKALSFAVALGLVAGMASSAVASDMLDFHGTARVRGVRQDLSQGTAQNKKQEYDQRVRFQMNAKVNDTVTVKTRMTLRSDQLGQTTAGNDVALDRAWIEIKDQALTGGTWSYGRMPASWTKFFSWGGTADRIKAMYKLNDSLTIGAFIQKTSEMSLASTDYDKDAYSVLVVGNAGDTKYKVIAISTDNDDPTLKNGDGVQGLMIDANVVAKAGPATIEAEVAYKGDDQYESVNNKAQMAEMIHVSMGLGDGIGLAVIGAYATNNFKADDDYTPSLLIGTSQVTAITDFGGSQATVVGNSDSAYLLAAGANIKLSDPASLTVALGYYDQSDIANMSVTELDVAFNYNMAKNTDFKLGVAYGDVKNWSAADDSIYSAGWQITTKW